MTIQIKLWWSDGLTKTVDAEQVNDDFAVHNHWRGDVTPGPQCWQAVHIRTGMAIPRRYYTQEAARQVALDIAALADWSTSTIDEVTSVAAAVNKQACAVLDQATAADEAAYFDADLPTWPTSPHEVTADRLARFYTAQANSLGAEATSLAGAFFGGDKPPAERDQTYLRTSLAYLNGWTAALLLRELLAAAPARAEEVAQVLWDAHEDGGLPGEYLYDWLIGYRINPATLAARQAEVKAKARAGRQQPAAPAPAGGSL